MIFLRSRLHVRFSSTIPSPPNISKLAHADEMKAAREWITAFKALDIPKHFVEWTFARSSGPGGQNVNKLNTKATARIPLHSKWIPIWAHAAIRKSASPPVHIVPSPTFPQPYFVPSTQSVLVSSSTHRSQSQNVDECLSKLHQLVFNSASADIKNETTAAQKERVAGLEKAAKQRNRRMKDARSALKRSRSKGSWE